jgi:hypothetical protein
MLDLRKKRYLSLESYGRGWYKPKKSPKDQGNLERDQEEDIANKKRSWEDWRETTERTENLYRETKKDRRKTDVIPRMTGNISREKWERTSDEGKSPEDR